MLIEEHGSCHKLFPQQAKIQRGRTLEVFALWDTVGTSLFFLLVPLLLLCPLLAGLTGRKTQGLCEGPGHGGELR